MWHTINETLSNLCVSALWDDSIWNSSVPDVTSCFKSTILAWLPCAFLWTFLPLEIYYLRRTKAISVPFNRFYTLKLGFIAVLQTKIIIDIVRFYQSDSSLIVDIYTYVIQFLSFSLFSGLTYARIKCGGDASSSGILFIFSFLLALCGAPQFRTELKFILYSSPSREDNEDNDSSQEIFQVVHCYTYLVYYVSVLFIFLLNCFSGARPVVKIQSDRNNACPEKDSPFLSRIFFAWSDRFAWKGYRKTLKYDDLWELDDEMCTEQLIERFESKWHFACNRLQKKTLNASNVKIHCDRKKMSENEFDGLLRVEYEPLKLVNEVSILRPLYEIFGWQFWFGVVILKLVDSSLHFCNSLMLKFILDFIDSENEVLWHGYFYVFVLTTISVVQSLFFNNYQHLMYRTGLQIRTALVAAVYKKALKISSSARRDFSFGEIINLVSVDAQTFTLIVPYFPVLFICPMEICLAVYFIWTILGACVLGGVAVMVILTIISFVFLYKIQKQRMKQMKHKDKRLKLTDEVFSGIKILKLYACEPSFEKEIVRIRKNELEVLKNTAYLHAGSTFAWVCALFLLCFVTFGLYVLSSKENVLSAQAVFVSLSLFTIMKWNLELMPWIVTRYIQANVAIKRISKFLNLEELDSNAVSHEQLPEAIVIENGEFSWESTRGTPTLSNINLTINSGDLIAIVGPVGCGKSSLLSAILGEMYKKSGLVNTTGKLAYVPQQAWIQNTTLRDNITFGDETKHPFYEMILESCALTSDLKMLSSGDQTEIGEKVYAFQGLNLSGGQKQRVSLARAVFSEADIYLLDDPLSAVDAQVGKHIFENVIGSSGLLKNKTRIFVTHNVSYLPQVDRIIALQNGNISETGTYKELLSEGGDFADFLATYLKAGSENDAETITLEKEAEILSNNDETSKSKNFSESENYVDEEEDNELVKYKLTECENTSSSRNTKSNIYAYYLRAMGPLLMGATILANLFYQIFSVKANYWLSEWANIAENSNKTNDDDHLTIQYRYLSIYALFGLGQAISVTTQTIVLFIGTLNAAKCVHDRLLNSVLHWPVVTFDRVPLGRILNRFGSDTDVLDGLSVDLLDLVTYAGFVMSTLFVISYNTPLFMGTLVPIGILYYFIQKIYTAVSKQLKRLESASKSPVYSHFGDTLAGAHSIRAYGLQAMFVKVSEKKINLNQKCSYACAYTYRWFVVRLDLIGHFIIFSVALLAVHARNTISAALVGLSINYAIQMIGDLYYLVVMITGVKTSIVALERIKEYTDTDQEALWVVPEVDKTVAENWPNEGEIVFKDFQMRYREDLEPVLKEITFTIKGGEKVGVVGRTGAGKSSLTLSLFRIIEAAGGTILIDGTDISKIGLHTLRSRLTIIPQDPVLFSGTLRMNLDPAGRYSDESIWKTLESVNLKAYITSLNFGLQCAVEDGGSNFSVGQRQLLCLARALLRKTRVLVLDEATAAIDFATDDLIQATIRKEFSECTVLTIAHRLNTVLDYDRIMVMDRGCVVEFDSPESLLQSEQSVFYNMVVDAGLK